MVLAKEDLEKLLLEKKLVVDPFDPLSLGTSSIDLKLGSILLRYPSQVINLRHTSPIYEEIIIPEEGYLLKPGEFVLGMTKESIQLNNEYQGFIETKGNIARAGLQVHNSDGHIDPGFTGNITLEIKNMNENNVEILLFEDIYICQIYIFTLKNPTNHGYKGKYTGKKKPTQFLP